MTGRAWGVHLLLGVGAAMAATPVLVAQPAFAVPAPMSAGWWVMAAGLVVHAAGGLAAIATALQALAREVAPPLAATESLADWRGDSGALATGAPPYERVAARVRRQARLARVVAAILAGAAALTLLPAVALVLAEHRAGRIGALAATLGAITPSFLLLFMLPASRALAIPRGGTEPVSAEPPLPLIPTIADRLLLAGLAAAGGWALLSAAWLAAVALVAVPTTM
ncbi:MAG: hypothetical protein NW201_08180 [Gemmatimonadales bacterium]|nr:hypothetical protein [Gemmatimonadales bacterium]